MYSPLLRYNMSMLNGDGNLMHFGANESGLYPSAWLLLLVQAGLCYYASWVRRDLLRMDKYHHTARMLVVSVGCQFLGAALDLGRLHAFLLVGERQAPGLKGLGFVARLFFAAAHVLLIAQLLLVAKGWTVVRRKLPAQERVKIAACLSAYSAVFVAMIAWQAHVPDRLAVSPMDTPAGLVLVVMRTLGAVWLIWAICSTLTEFQAKRGYVNAELPCAPCPRQFLPP
jgi:hypothetical protein